MEVAIALLVMLVLLVLKGFYSGSEIALVNADKIRMRHQARQGDKGAEKVLRAFERPDVLLCTTLIGTNISTIALTTIGTLLMVGAFGEQGDLIAFLVFTPLFLIFGEIVPKSVMQQVANRITPIIIYPLGLSTRLFSPIIFVFSRIARAAARIAGGDADQSLFINREQLSAVAEMAEQSDALRAIGRGQIQRVIQFAQITAVEVMVPLHEVRAIKRDKSMRHASRIFVREGYHRLPVYEGSTANITGVLSLSEWDILEPDKRSGSIEAQIKPPLYVTPQQTVDDLLPLVSRRDDHMGIVVDEYGSAIGIVSMEDIAARVFGDIDMGRPRGIATRMDGKAFEKHPEGGFVVDPRGPMLETTEHCGITLPQGDYHTLGGFVTARLRRIPRVGDEVVEQGWRFVVLDATERAVTELRVLPVDDPEVAS